MVLALGSVLAGLARTPRVAGAAEDAVEPTADKEVVASLIRRVVAAELEGAHPRALATATIARVVTPDLLGGAKSVMIGNLIQNQFAQLNQPFGSAISLILTVAVLLLLAIAMKAGLKASELA